MHQESVRLIAAAADTGDRAASLRGEPVVFCWNCDRDLGLARVPLAFSALGHDLKRPRVEVVKDGAVRDAKSILSVLTLGVSQGTTITVRAEGPQAGAAVAALTDLVDRDFGE